MRTLADRLSPLALKPSRQRHARRAFTLVELLVVVLILAIVIAILLPAIAGARRGAKNASTLATLNGLAAATGAFIGDNAGRTPGYFSPADMGNADNEDRGFCAMQNVLLDLSGGVTSPTASGAGIITVGPRPSGTAKVDLGQIGATGGAAGQKAYFNPDRNFLSDAAERPSGQVSSVPDNLLVPHLLDAFGNPVLAWTRDDRPATNFAARNSGGEPAQFYWASNAGMLKSPGVGKNREPALFTLDTTPGSLIGQGKTDAQLAASLEGLLGNPAFPSANYSPSNRKAQKARGSVVFHAAGADGMYLSTTDRGGKTAPGTSGQVQYTTDGDAVRDAFDDTLVPAGN
jgi:prepilin-type N-terminal cleavage/methylation domain-containing protein